MLSTELGLSCVDTRAVTAPSDQVTSVLRLPRLRHREFIFYRRVCGRQDLKGEGESPRTTDLGHRPPVRGIVFARMNSVIPPSLYHVDHGLNGNVEF